MIGFFLFECTNVSLCTNSHSWFRLLWRKTHIITSRPKIDIETFEKRRHEIFISHKNYKRQNNKQVQHSENYSCVLGSFLFEKTQRFSQNKSSTSYLQLWLDFIGTKHQVIKIYWMRKINWIQNSFLVSIFIAFNVFIIDYFSLKDLFFSIMPHSTFHSH